ncbi:MAG TPA: hypothetical protein VFR35_05875 [Actinoplanes sp.]|nr:hypothetical protein [Actinoplanes sp.]
MRRVLAAACGAATALAMTACGGEPPSAAPPSPASPAPTAAAASQSPAPAAAAASRSPVPPGSAAPVSGAYAPVIDPAAFRPAGDNPLFPLRPGLRWDYRSATADGVETTVVTVTARTKTIMGVTCVEVRDTVRIDGRLKEDTLDWYAHRDDGSVWYFGEDTKEYENGKVTTTKGSWVAGVDGALPGIVMPARPQAGDRYRQEYDKGDAEDMAEVLDIADRATVPTGGYDRVVKTKETTPLEPDVLEHKYYAPGVGMVLTIDVADGGTRDELVRFSG